MEPITEITGTVVHGKAFGRTVGMPTANLLPDAAEQKKRLLLSEGVYATKCYVNNAVYYGVTNIGPRPTVDTDQAQTIETLLLDFDGDLYGKTMTVAFYLFLRGIHKFPSLAAVKEQVDADSVRVRAYFSESSDSNTSK